MDYSFDDEVRSAEIFRQAVGDLLQDIRVYKCHLDEMNKRTCFWPKLNQLL